MKKIGMLAATLLLLGTANVKADVYKDCVDKVSTMPEIIECISKGIEETDKIIEGKYEELSNTEYFKNWNQGAGMFNGNFKKLLDEWKNYRSTYCELYGYSSTQGEGSMYTLNVAECILELAKRQNKDITVILNNYKSAE